MASPIPIELCPSSNMATLGLSNLENHPTAGALIRQRYPFAVCTDDSGVFSTTLSTEYAQLAVAFRLTKAEMAALAVRAAECIWRKDEMRENVIRTVEDTAKEALKG